MSYAEPRQPGVTGPPAAAAPTAPLEPAAAGAPASTSTRRTFSALKYPEFRYLFGANTLQFGSMQMQLLVRGILVFQLTGSYEALGRVSLAHAIPGLLLTPFGGLIADRAPKRTVVAVAQAINLVNAWVLALLAFNGALTFPHLLISAVLQGGVNSVLMPTKQALTPDTVPRHTLMNAIALLTSGQNLMQLVGPALGGILVAWAGAASGFGVMGAMYAVGLLFTTRLPVGAAYPSTDAAEAAPTRARTRHLSARGALTDLVDGLRYVGRDATIRTLIAVNFIVIFISMPYTMMLPGFVTEVLHGGATELGWLMTVTGIGAVGGSLMVASLSERKRGRLLILTGVILGGSLLAFAVSTNYYLTLPIMLVVGFGHAMRMSIGQVLVQHYSPDHYRGRVMSVWMMQYSIMSVGTYGVGLLSEAFGPQWALGSMAATLVVLMGLVWLAVPLMRRIE
ncbi:MAG: MFS transporter [Dehalococcoidia bacterium]